RWLFAKKCAAQTRLNHRRLLSNFFSFCEARGYCERNPVAHAAKVKVVAKPPGILSPKETAAILVHCPAEILPAVAIGFFAGLRRAEIERLDWSEIDLSRGFVTVSAENAKTARRRLVEITPNLRAWLEPHARSSGPVRPSEAIYREHFTEARKSAGVTNWPTNAMRHSFASYHLARGQDAAKTALQLGHSDTAVLFEHYRELARPDEGEAYFAISPESGMPKNVVSISAIA
ncbi:MAG: tyrosine-type recombinase/integrase, partial [Verrucomicrobiae bacterium]|nr:tyrosine-type recombinase/integrase [Verrucomicrobiae bacterium]